jgi:hypothetical protein
MITKINGWWRAAANDEVYESRFRLTEFGLAD